MTKPIHIAYLIDTIDSDQGGTEKQLLNIISRLDPKLFLPSLICLYDSPWMFENPLPCEVISLGYKGFLKPNFPSILNKYVKLLRDRRFDIVQTFFEDSMLIGCMGKVLSTTKHVLLVSRRDLGLGADEPAYHRIYKKIKPLVLKSADGIIANAMAIKGHVADDENVPLGKIHVIGNGIDLPAVPSAPPHLFKEYQADIWICITANLKPVKRIDLLIRALSHISSRNLSEIVRAVILGDGRLRADLFTLATDLGIADRVHFIGSADNVMDYLHYVDIGVLCSDKEGLSNAILEYMACGLPVVATAVGGNVELVDESNGVCVPAGDYLALGNALTRLIAAPSLRKEMGEKSLAKVHNNFTWEMVIPQWEHYYHSVTENRSPDVK